MSTVSTIVTDDVLSLLEAADLPEGFSPRVVVGEISAANADVATVKFQRPDSTTGLGRMSVHEFAGPRRWVVGNSYTMLQLDPGPRPFFSTADDRLVAAVLDGVSPEVRSGKVRVMGVARRAGARTKIAVAATVDGIDPVAACVGRAHNRVDAIRAALGGEQVDVVAWHPDRGVFLSNALQPAQCVFVWTDPNRPVALAVAPDHQMSAAVGGAGLNSALAGRLVGVALRVVPESAASEIDVIAQAMAAAQETTAQ